MSKIGALVFDLQEQEQEAEFFGGHVKQQKESLVSEFVALFAAYDTYQSVLERITTEKSRIKPVVAELNFSN